MGFGKDKKGVIFRQENVISLGTLAGSSAVKQTAPPAMTDSFRLIKTEGQATLEGGTQVTGDGPIVIGIASDDLSTGEIEEAIGVAPGIPLSRGDVVGSDRAMRPVWLLGTIPFTDGNGGKEIKISWSKTIRWTFSDETAFTLFAFNLGSGALTTGGLVRFLHTAFGVWVGA